MPLNLRSGRPRQTAVDAFRAACAQAAAPCHLCSNPIDYGIGDRFRHPLRFSTDERIPLSRGGSATDPANFLPSHACCNSSRGNRPITPTIRRQCAAVYRKHATRTSRTLSAAW